jgi:hypothetical protein
MNPPTYNESLVIIARDQHEQKIKDMITLLTTMEQKRNDFKDPVVLDFYFQIWSIGRDACFSGLKSIIQGEAEKNNSCAQYLLFYTTTMHDSNDIKWLHMASDSGNAHAQYELSCHFLLNEKNEKNLREKTELRKMAAEKGHMRSMVWVADTLPAKEKKEMYQKIYRLQLENKKYYINDIIWAEGVFPTLWDEFMNHVKKLEDDNKKLIEENDDLKQQVYYSPGAPGALETEKHFEHLVSKQNSEH